MFQAFNITRRVVTCLAGLCLIAGTAQLSASATSPHFKMSSAGEVFATWLGDSGGKYPFVQFSHRSSTGIWSEPKNLSVEINPSIRCGHPTLYLTEAGVVVLWQYYTSTDTTAPYSIASAILPYSSSEWHVSTISLPTEDAVFNDQRLETDANGNLVAMWTSIYPFNKPSSTVVRVASYNPLNNRWSIPITLDK